MPVSFVQVLPSAELEEETPGEPRLKMVTIEGTDILLGRLSGGEVIAFASHCPHQQTHLESATFFDGKVRCSLHVYLYDPKTGENVVPARDCNPANLWKLKPGYLPVYPVEERDGWIWVGDTPKPPPASYDPAKERPPAPGARRPAPAAEPLAGAGDRRPHVLRGELAPAIAAPLAQSSVGARTEHPTKAVKVARGVTFSLNLPTTPQPGCMWRTEVDGPLLAVVEERFQPGDPPTHLVRVAARGEGESTLRCFYGRPWDAQPLELRVYKVLIEQP